MTIALLCYSGYYGDKTLTSTSFIIGTGLKKWRPPNRSCLVVELANCVICKDEVLLANIVCLEKRNIWVAYRTAIFLTVGDWCTKHK